LQKFECIKDNETEYFNNTICELRKGSQKGSYEISAFTDILIPLTYVNVNYKLIYKSTNKVLFNLTFEYCSSYNNLPPLIHIIVEYINNFSKNFIHACPYTPQKHIGLENFPLDANIPIFALINFQRGEYKSSLYSRDKKGRPIIYVNLLFTVSPKRISKKGSSG